MKKLLGAALAGLLGISLLSAQTPKPDGGSATTGFSRSNNVDSQLTKSIPGNAGEGPVRRGHEVIGKQPPRPSGSLYGIVQHGANMINPLAPASYGDGRQYLTQNPSAMGPATRSNTSGEESREFGGWKLIGWDF